MQKTIRTTKSKLFPEIDKFRLYHLNNELESVDVVAKKLFYIIENISSLKTSELAWSIFPKKDSKKDASYKIIYENEVISPWKLIKKI